MSSLVSNNDLVLELEKYIPSCSELNIISAFVTMPAYNWLNTLLRESKPIINLVGRFTPQDFLAGASEFKAVRECMKNGFQVSALSNLHAKIYQIDNNIIYTGSANFTAKGMALVESCNLESCCRVEPSEASKLFISKILDGAIKLTDSMLNDMEEYLMEFEHLDSNQVPHLWPEDIVPKTKELFVTDFPLVEPGQYEKSYDVNTSLEFSIIERNYTQPEVAREIFLKSKAYQWLLNQVKNNESERALGFGQVSSLLHNALCDDPAPYRKDIKNLQANLYKYIDLYAQSELEIYVPGKRSQVLRLVK